MKKIINKIENFGDTLSPNADTQDKIWGVVSSKLSSENGVRNNFRMIWFMKNSIKYSLIVFVVCFVIAVPAYLFTSMNMPQNIKTSYDSSTSNGGVQGLASTGNSNIMTDIQGMANSAKEAMSPVSSNANVVDNSTKENVRAKNVDASLIYNVIDIWGSVDEVYKAVSDYDAYTTDVSTSTTGAHFTIKVPIGKFDAIHQRLRGIASSIESESINSIDKQNEISSLNTSVKSHEDKVAQLKDDLAKATTQEQKNSIQKQIDNENEQIKSTNDSLSTLTKTTDVATINLELNQDSSATSTDFSSSLQSTWNMIKGVCITWFRIVLLALVFIIAISPVAIPMYLITKNRKNQKVQNKGTSTK